MTEKTASSPLLQSLCKVNLFIGIDFPCLRLALIYFWSSETLPLTTCLKLLNEAIALNASINQRTEENLHLVEILKKYYASDALS